MMRNTSRPAILPASLVALRCESLKYAGTVITACVILSPSLASASAFIFDKIIAEISGGENVFFCPLLPLARGRHHSPPSRLCTERDALLHEPRRTCDP